MNDFYCMQCGNVILIDKTKEQSINTMLQLMINNTHIENIDYDKVSVLNACIECCDYPDYKSE